MSSRLIHAAERGLVVFCGAGVSMVPPSFLPSWWELNEQIVASLARLIEPFGGREQARAWASLLNSRRNSGSFPPEYQAEIISQHFEASYFKVLQCLDGDEPNEVHLSLAELAKTGAVRFIVTSNFDRLLELAFAHTGVPLEVHYTAAHFESLAARLAAGPQADMPCQLLKLHGSVEDADTLVDTLAQRMRGLSPAICTALRWCLHQHHWLFLGYSGADLDANPQYLCLQAEAPAAVGLSWLDYDAAGTAVPASVTHICSLYGDRAEVVRGRLPGWLQQTFGALLPPPVGPTTAVTAEALELRRAKARETLVRHTQDWAQALGAESAALVIADMLAHVAGDPSAARDLLKRVLSAPSTPAGAHAAVSNALANTLNTLGDTAGARQVAEEALSRLPDGAGQERIGLLSTLGLIDFGAGAYEQALATFDRVYAASLSSGDDERRGIALHNRALVLEKQARIDEARACYDEELALVRQLGDVMAQAQIHNNLSDMLRRTARYPEAIEAAKVAMTLRERLGDDLGVANALGNIGSAMNEQGDAAGATAMYEKVLAIFRRIGHRPGEVKTLLNLGVVANESHDHARAERLLRSALALSIETGLAGERMRAMWELATVCRETDRREEARSLLDEALALARASRDRTSEANVLVGMGVLQWRAGAFTEAEVALRDAIRIRESIDEPSALDAARSNLALVLRAQGRQSEAATLLKAVLSGAQQRGEMGAAAHHHFNLGAIKHEQGLADEAISHLDAAQCWYREAGQTTRAVEVLAALGGVCGSRGKVSASLGWFDEAIALAVDPAHKEIIAKASLDVAKILLENGYRDVAEQYLQRIRALGMQVEITMQAST